MKVLKNVNFTMKEMINAESATKVIKDYGGQKLKITGLLIGEKEFTDSETGENKLTKVGILKTDKGLISSISNTVIASIDTIINAYTDSNMLKDIEKGIELQVRAEKSAKKREFFFLELV